MVSDTGLRVLGALSDLNDWDLLWLHLFIDQCRDRYFDRKLTEPQLATGSMVRLPPKWAEDDRQLPVPIEFELKLETRSSAELNSEFLHTIEPKWAESYNPNLWMEERFAGSVPDDCLYLPNSALNGDTPLLLLGSSGDRELARRDTSSLPFWEKEKLPAVSLQGLSGTALSTPDRVIRDCHFLARHNQVQAIALLVKEDYEARKGDMQRWFYKAAAKYLPNLIDDLLALNHERFCVDSPAHQDALRALGRGKLVQGKGNTAQVVSSFRAIKLWFQPVRKQHLPYRHRDIPSMSETLKLIDYNSGCYRCAADRSEPAQLFIELDVSSVFDLMTVTGLPYEKIPAELRHRGISTYTGNSILDRIDPISHIRNPWDSLILSYIVPVSLNAFKTVRRRLGLPIPKASELEVYAREHAKDFNDRRRQNLEPISIAGLD